jgi:hypothetical protein
MHTVVVQMLMESTLMEAFNPGLAIFSIVITVFIITIVFTT